MSMILSKKHMERRRPGGCGLSFLFSNLNQYPFRPHILQILTRSNGSDLLEHSAKVIAVVITCQIGNLGDSPVSLA